jgi:hypothetical protein
MKLLTDYFELQEKIYKYFGYVEDWRVIPIDDRREMYWSLTGEGGGDEVHYSPTKETMEAWKKADWDFEAPGVGDDCYSNVIYTQRFLPKWVYRGEDYTMVCVDTRTDGNVFLAIYDNKKEVLCSK